MELNLKDKVAIVTASTNGIGLACALKLANEGAIVYLAARNKDKAMSVINAWKNLKLKFVHFDTTDDKSVNDCVKYVYDVEKKVDILVNNFGTTNVAIDKTIIDTSYEDYLSIIDKNIKPTFIMCQQAIKYMSLAKTKGSIINISSVAALINDNSRIAYSSAKTLVNTLSHFVCVDGSLYGIRCNTIMPGYIETTATSNNMSPEFLNKFLSFNLVKRAGSVDDIASLVAFFSSDVSSYISGECISVSGGFNKASPLFGIMNEIKNKK